MNTEQEIDSADLHRFLQFKVGNESYATPLLGIREVMAYTPPKPVPNKPKEFLGVINIRGEVVGVIDLRIIFGHEATHHAHNSYVVIQSDSGSVAVLVDGIESVASIPPNLIDTVPPVRIKISAESLLGIAEVEGKLVTLIDLAVALFPA